MPVDPITRFHNDLSAVVLAKAPLELDFKPKRLNQQRILKHLKQAQQQVENHLQNSAKLSKTRLSSNAESEESLVEQAVPSAITTEIPTSKTPRLIDDLAGLDKTSPLPSRYLAALNVYCATGRMTPVLEGLTMRGISRQQLVRITRWPIFYVSILLVMCATGLIFYWNLVLPEIVSFRLDTPKSKWEPGGWDYQTWLPALFVGISSLGVLFLLFLVSGGFLRILLLVGGTRYLDLISVVVAQRTIPLLLSSGVQKDQAVQWSCDLCSVSNRATQSYFPVHVSDDPDAWLQGAEYWMLAADQRLQHLKLLFPVLVISIVGGLLVLMYGMILYGPVIATMRELIFTGVDQ